MVTCSYLWSPVFAAGPERTDRQATGADQEAQEGTEGLRKETEEHRGSVGVLLSCLLQTSVTG